MIIYLYFLTIYHKTKHFTVIIIINVFRRFLSDTHVRYPIVKDIIFPVTSILFKTIERHNFTRQQYNCFKV